MAKSMASYQKPKAKKNVTEFTVNVNADTMLPQYEYEENECVSTIDHHFIFSVSIFLK